MHAVLFQHTTQAITEVDACLSVAAGWPDGRRAAG
jgi:hypothetical protein